MRGRLTDPLNAIVLAVLILAPALGSRERQRSLWELQEGAAQQRNADRAVIGERPAVEVHLNQAMIDSGEVGFDELFRHGKMLFEARFNRLDGQGRPTTTGHGVPRATGQPAFIRTSGPDANSCMGCHFQPCLGGAGEFSANVFVLAQERDPVVESVSEAESNERNSPSLMGSGAIEMLAREMSMELIAIRESAKRRARATHQPIREPLHTKGISFGTITVLPDGRVDPNGIEGVDWDLVVKPFHQKGAVASIREFTNTALNQHHGIQSVERFGQDVDPDGDGKMNELTVGDITALTVFQAALSVPSRAVPDNPSRREAARRGETLFTTVGCDTCHTPILVLNSPFFSEPGPFNPVGNLRQRDVSGSFRFDLTKDGPGPRLENLSDGRAVVRAYTDLKRHDLNDQDYKHFANERVPQGTLLGTAVGAFFTETPKPRSTREFLTHRLWDVGNTGPYGHRGDLTTLTEAIYFHGGEARDSRDSFFALPPGDEAALIEFLMTLQILPESPFGTWPDKSQRPKTRHVNANAGIR